MSITFMAVLGVCLGLLLVLLAILLEHRLHPRRRQRDAWQHKIT